MYNEHVPVDQMSPECMVWMKMNEPNEYKDMLWSQLIYSSSGLKTPLELSCLSFSLQLIGYCVRLKLWAQDHDLEEVCLCIFISMMGKVKDVKQWAYLHVG